MEKNRDLDLGIAEIKDSAKISHICYKLSDKLTDGKWGSEDVLQTRIFRSTFDGPGGLAYDDEVGPSKFETVYYFEAAKEGYFSGDDNDEIKFDELYSIERTVGREIDVDSIPEHILEDIFDEDGYLSGEADYINFSDIDEYEIFQKFKDTYRINSTGRLIGYSLGSLYTIDDNEVWSGSYDTSENSRFKMYSSSIDSDPKPDSITNATEASIKSYIDEIDYRVAEMMVIEGLSSSVGSEIIKQERHRKTVLDMLGQVSVGLLSRRLFR